MGMETLEIGIALFLPSNLVTKFVAEKLPHSDRPNFYIRVPNLRSRVTQKANKYDAQFHMEF